MTKKEEKIPSIAFRDYPSCNSLSAKRMRERPDCVNKASDYGIAGQAKSRSRNHIATAVLEYQYRLRSPTFLGEKLRSSSRNVLTELANTLLVTR